MTPRWTFFDRLPEVEARAILVEAIERRRGCVAYVARDVDLSRMHVYRLIRRWDLWDLVDAAREARRRSVPEWQRRARAALVSAR